MLVDVVAFSLSLKAANANQLGVRVCMSVGGVRVRVSASVSVFVSDRSKAVNAVDELKPLDGAFRTTETTATRATLPLPPTVDAAAAPDELSD